MIASAPTVDFTVLGVYYTVASIIIIYHLSSLQWWLNRADELEREARGMRLVTASGDLSRTEHVTVCNEHKRRFPWLQILVLGVAIGILSWLALDAAGEIHGIPHRYSVIPTVVLAATFVLVTVGTFFQGGRRLDAAKTELETH
ncbi:MAG TPA: hypothetical protein VMI13_13260 [Solirubrobacteraceae bacterium]|nr:hypothetical protein [Solirubrobacteraceae bacterium]